MIGSSLRRLGVVLDDLLAERRTALWQRVRAAHSPWVARTGGG